MLAVRHWPWFGPKGGAELPPSGSAAAAADVSKETGDDVSKEVDDDVSKDFAPEMIALGESGAVDYGERCRKASPATLMAKRTPQFRIPEGCPEGPWASDSEALAAINRWTSDHNKVGGSWGVTWSNGLSAGNSKRGPQHSLGCAKRKKHQCGWSMRLEETTEGWMIYTFSEHKSTEGRPLAKENGHSHDLCLTLGQ